MDLDEFVVEHRGGGYQCFRSDVDRELWVSLIAPWGFVRNVNKIIDKLTFQIEQIQHSTPRLLYGTGASSHFSQAAALTGYYLLAFLYGGNPLIVSWMVANTAGQTKKSAIMSLYAGASSAGNIIGELNPRSNEPLQRELN